MNIFNSLGSNYDAIYVLKALFSIDSKKDAKKLKNLLEERYQGKPILFYKGREALSFALKILNLPKKNEIAINGFTCVAVFNAIRYVGFEPLCLDLEETGGLNFTPESLENALKSNENIKVVIVQNTLGYPCDIEKIEKLCRKHKLILIEDLAHCAGTVYKDGREAGTVGDFVVLSFSQDKIIDAVSGGALVIRNKKYTNAKLPGAIERHLEGVVRLKDRIYPLETYKIRSLYKYGVGKPYHFLLKKLNLLSEIMNPSFYEFLELPNWHAMLALYQFNKLSQQLAHRRKIAQVYVQNLDKKLLFPQILQDISLSSNLRFPIIVRDRKKLIQNLAYHRIFVSDVWYNDVAPECPNAVNVSKRILNLPTHINVSESDAQKICKIMNDFIEKERVRS